MVKKIQINNEIRDMTPEEELAFNEHISERQNAIAQEKIEKQDAETKKASAKSKLLALGLTEEEIKLTFGL